MLFVVRGKGSVAEISSRALFNRRTGEDGMTLEERRGGGNAGRTHPCY